MCTGSESHLVRRVHQSNGPMKEAVLKSAYFGLRCCVKLARREGFPKVHYSESTVSAEPPSRQSQCVFEKESTLNQILLQCDATQMCINLRRHDVLSCNLHSLMLQQKALSFS